MQAMSFLEDGGNVTSFNSSFVKEMSQSDGGSLSFIPEAHASVTSDYSKRFPTTQ